jgi:hypothetical protein
VSAPRALRPLWLVGGSVVAVAALAFGTLQVIVHLAHRDETLVSVVDDPGLRVVDISLEQGSVRVIGTDKATVTVTARISHGLVATQHREEVEGDRLVIQASCNRVLSSFCRTDYTIEAPASLAVVARTSHDTVSASTVAGPLDLRTQHGDVEVDRITGDAVLAATTAR